MSQRRGGITKMQINGVPVRTKTAVTYSPGQPTREAIVGADGIHGYKETPAVGYIECEITDGPEMSLQDLFATKQATVVIQLANGKTFVLNDAYYAGEGSANSEEGAIPVRFEGVGDEI